MLVGQAILAPGDGIEFVARPRRNGGFERIAIGHDGGLAVFVAAAVGWSG